MLDLSFLTEEEQEAIMKVLQRDADLKKAEEERVRTLEETVDDTNELKNKTGQWFYEAKSKRHRDKIHGADLIRASIRKKKPQTIAELSQSRSDKNKKSWVNNVNKDLFIPPELFGVMEEPEKEDEEEKTPVQLYRSAPRVDSLALSETDSAALKAVSSPSKQRKNPFNDPASNNDFELAIENQISQNGTPHLHETPGKDLLVSSEKSQDIKTMPKVEFNEVTDISAVDGTELRNEKTVPKPKARTVTYKISDLQSDSDSSLTKPTKRNDSMNGTGTRKGILKRTPSSSSTDSEILRVSLDSQSKPVPPASPILEGEVEKNHLEDQPDHSSQNSLDRLKQVRFTSADALPQTPDALPQTPDSHNGREIGEFDLLESDYSQHSTDAIDGFKNKDNEPGSFKKPEIDIQATVSEGENGDGGLKVTLPSLSSNLDKNLKLLDGPKVELVPNSYIKSVQTLPENSELSQDGVSSTEDTDVRNSNGPSVNILEDGAPAIGTTLNKESADLSDDELRTSKLMIDQQPIYAKIISPRVSKLASADITQGNASVDENEPSCKTETMRVDTILPKHDDKRDHSNVSLHAHQLQSNANVPVSEELRIENSKNIRDQQPLHAEIKSPQVSELNSTNHQQGKPARVEDLTPNTSSKPDKYTIEFKKASDESISKVLDWFNRDSVSGGDKAVHMNAAPGKVFVEERKTAVKTDNSALLTEYARPNTEQRLNDYIQESQTTNRSKPSTPTDGTQWRQERLSFGKVRNGAGKSGDVGLYREVGVTNKTLETFPQRVEKQFKGNSAEKLVFGTSNSGSGKMYSELEYPSAAIQKVSLLAVESAPLSDSRSQANRNGNVSENNKEKSQLEKSGNEQLGYNVQIDDADEIEETEPSVLDEKDLQEDTVLYWRHPSILEQNAPRELPKTLEKVEATDGIPSSESKRMAAKSSIDKSTEEIDSCVTFDSKLVKAPAQTKVKPKASLEKEMTNEISTSNVKAPAKTQIKPKHSLEKETNDFSTLNVKTPAKVKPKDSLEKKATHKSSTSNDKFIKSTWESKASVPMQIPSTYDKTAKHESLSEKRGSEFVPSPKPQDLQRKADIAPMSRSSEKLNVDQSVPGKVRSPDSQNKHNFQVLSFKERLNETPTVPLSDPEKFQNLRNFWGTGNKSPGKPEISPSVRHASNLHGSKDSGFVELETNLSHTSQDGLLNQDKWSSSEESDFSPREWYRKATEPTTIVPARDNVVETVNKVFAPSKSENDAFKSSLEKLGKQATEDGDNSESKVVEASYSLPKPEVGAVKTVISSESLADKSQPVQESLYDLIQRRSQNRDSEKAQESQRPEVRETVEKETVQKKDDSTELKVGFEKLQKEASDITSPFNQTAKSTFSVVKSGSMSVQSSYNQSKERILPQEIEEIIEKKASPPKADLTEFNDGLQKLLTEASVTGTLSSEVTKNEDAGKPESQSVFENMNYSFPGVPKVPQDGEEIKENVSKIEAPEKVQFSAFDNGLDKLYKEAAKPLPVSLDITENKEEIDGNITNQESQILERGVLKVSPEHVALSYQQTQLPTEIKETVDKTAVRPKADTSAFDEGLKKLFQEALDASKSEQPVEILSGLPNSSVYSSDFKMSVKKDTFSQADVRKEKLARDADLVKETHLSEAPNRNLAYLQKTVPTNDPPAYSPLHFEKENGEMAVTYPDRDYEHLTNEESLNEDLVDGAGFRLDAQGSGGFVRASTPVEEGDVAVKSSILQRHLSPQDENDGVPKTLDSCLSDGNAGLYAGSWHNSSRSEEDSNPVFTVLRRSASKPKPSKSLEDISSAASIPEKVDVPKEELELSAENDKKAEQREAFYETISDRSTMPAYPDNRFQDPEKLKRLSKSVPDFLQDESDDRETDSTSEGSFPLGRHKKTPSSLTNLSGSSGMASLSSVSGSVMSIYSGDFGNLDIKGNIQFAIDYVEQLQEFHIFVAQCKELAVADVKKQRSDPYVKSYLLPGKEKMGKRKTAVRKKTLNPAYNEILRMYYEVYMSCGAGECIQYKINKQVLLTQKLNLSVWHNDTFGRNSFLGEVDIDLATWDWSNKHMNWYALQPRTPAAGIGLENRGEISVALKYTSTPPSGKNTASNGEVHIWVKSCSNLPILRGNRINSFVKCTVLPDTSRKSRQKTRTVDKTTNPVFNHTMVYDGFRAEDLREACVELTVWDHNRLANHFLGGLRLGLGSGKSYGTPVDWMDSTTYESSLWKKMIHMPNEWVEDTLQLRMLMMAKMTK